MKTILLLGILAISLSAVSQITDVPDKGTNSIRMPDSSYTFQQTQAISDWALISKTVYHYDEHNRAYQVDTWLYIASGLWQNQMLTMYTYDFNGNLSSILTKVHGNNSLFIVNEYDDADNLIRQTLNDWNGSAWAETAVNTYEYNNNLMISRRHTILPASKGDYSDFTYTYDENRRLINMLLEYFENNQLIVQQRAIYENDVYGNKISELAQVWEQNSWQNVLLAAYTYDNHGNQLSIITNTWQNGAWENLSRQRNTYNELDYHTELANDYWDGSEWIFSNITKWSYDPDNFLNSMVFRSYDLVWGQVSADSTKYFPNESLSMEEIAHSGTILLYPNPGNGLITLTGELPLESVEVYNLAGEKVRTIVPSQRHKMQLDLTDQVPGVYVIKAQTIAGTAIGKIVLR